MRSIDAGIPDATGSLRVVELCRGRQARRITARHALATLVALTVLITMPLHAQDAIASKEYAKRIAKADQLLDKEDFSSAVRAYSRANKVAGGNSTEALIGLAIAAYRAEQYADSQAAARQLLDLSGDQGTQVAAYNLLGLSILQSHTNDKDDLAEAERAFRHILKLGHNGPEVHLSLAMTLQALGRNTEALALAQELLSVETSERISDQARITVCRLRRTLASEAAATPPASPVGRAVEEPVVDGTIEEPIVDGTVEEAIVDGTIKEPVVDSMVAEPVIDGKVGEAANAGTVEERIVGGTVVAPVRIFHPQPEYPKKFLGRIIQVDVIVQVIINKEGCVVNTKTLSSSHVEFEMAAVRAMENWVFRPATLNGRVVDVYYNMTAHFGAK